MFWISSTKTIHNVAKSALSCNGPILSKILSASSVFPLLISHLGESPKGKIEKIKTEIKEIDGVVLYSCYVKKQKNMKQVLKESVYITLLSNIINNIEESVEVIFDSFNKKDFEESIVSTFMEFNNVISIRPFNSQWSAGLKFADNLCSVIRLHLTDRDEYNYYEIISEKVIKV